MKFKSQVFTETSGSIGGQTFSHNRGGMYTRARATPTNPNTPQQQVIRSAVSDLVNRWNNILTAARRAEWDLYALNTPLIDRLGEPRNAGGLGMYIRGNVPRIQVADPLVDAGPTIFNTGDYTQPTIGAVDAAGNTVSLAFTETDEWVDEDDTSMLLYASRPQNPSINYFKGPYQFAGKIEGDSAIPPTSPAVIALPFPVAIGQRVFFKANVTRADGRYSATFRGAGTAT